MKELLIPVGNMDCLKVAINAGADAVYLGGKKFGARAFANNFDDEEMINAIKLCHLYGVKIYVTVNTMIYESELDSVLDYLKFLHINGVDAVIVQDIGLIAAAREFLPNLEIHASTQVHNTNEDGLKFLSDLGVTRVVFARELSVDEINSINSELEYEAFIHGALCISYSGECLFSSMLMNRSGNRGACAGICRLPFKLYENDKLVDTNGDYILSTKELNTSNSFKKILDSKIYSLKVEGRMKSAEYVGCVTSLYRDLLDKYYNNKPLNVNKEILDDLSVIFNREYTEGFILNASNEDLMNIKTPNHLGIKLGNIIKYDKKYIYIKLDRELNQGDGIRFNDINEGMICNYIYDKNENLINHANIGDIVLLDNKYNIKNNMSVNKTIDIKVSNKYRNLPEKKIPINIAFKANINGLKLIIDDGVNKVVKVSTNVEEAINAPTSRERIEEQLSKLGNTPFKLNNIDIIVENNLFINIKELNELRRNAVDELINIRSNNKKEVIINEINNNINTNYDNSINISVLVRNEEQLKVCLEKNVNRIYVTSKKLYNQYKDNNSIYFRTYRVNDNSNYNNSLCTELGALYRSNNSIGDYYLNVSNHSTINYFSKYAKLLTLSVELDDIEIAKIMDYYDNKLNIEMIIYSNVELMITKYCPLKYLVNKNNVCNVCGNGNKYYLMDRNNEKYRILTDHEIHLTHIMDYKVLNKIDNLDYYKSLGINNFRIELLDETEDEVLELLNEVL